MPQTSDVEALRLRASGSALRRRLGISRTTLYRWRQLRDFPPPAVIRGLVLYDIEAVERWVSTHEQRETAAS